MARRQRAWTSFRDFVRRYSRSRAGVAGIAILLGFIVVAILAPVLTPHDPRFTMQLASSRSPPEWLDPTLPRNIYPISDPTFATLDALDEWTITTSDAIDVGWSATEGYPGVPLVEEGSGPGAIICSASSSLPQNHTATLERTFDYTYTPPRRFSVHIAYRTEVQGDAEWTVRVLIRQTTGNTRLLYELTEEGGSIEWSVPKPPIDTNNAMLRFQLFQDILADAKRIFATQGTYALVVQLSIATENSAATVYLDDVSARIWAEAYGLLGTDNYGRDLFTQLVYGSRISIIIGVFSALIAVILGLIVGLSAGYIGGWFDEFVMRTNDILLTIPGLPFLIVLTAVIGPTIWSVIMLIGLLGWMGIARLIRSQVLTFKTKAFVEAAQATGGGTWHIIRKHLVPNVMTMAYTQLALTVPGAIVTEAALSFLGLGDPFLQTWGKMLHDVQYYGAISEWWWALPPGICIALLSMSFVFIGYALDEILNPKLRQR